MIFRCKNMGCSSSSKILLLIFFLLSFFCTHILFVNTPFNAAEFFNVNGLNEVYRRESSGGLGNHVGNFFGEDGNEEQRTLVLEKFRSLLGLKDFYIGGGSPFLGNNDFSSTSTPTSPAPAPCPSEAPAPSPAPPPHRHSHPPSHHHHHLIPQVHRIQKKEKGKSKKVITAVLVSAGVGSLLCALGLFWGCQKFKKQRKKTTRTVSIYCTEAGTGGTSKHGASQSTGKKVNSDPGPHLFYLDSIGAALEPQPFCLKQNSIALNAFSNHNISNTNISGREDSDKNLVKSEVASDSDRFSSAGEIISAHEAVESSKLELEPDVCESSSPGNNITPEAADSSDDESFHSLCNSHSSEMRLSNVSAGSLSEISVTMSPNASRTSNCSEANENLTPSTRLPPATPPPPPPPPPVSSFLYGTISKSAFLPKKTKINVLSSAALPNASSTRSSVSSSESNQTPLSDSSLSPANPPWSPNGIPPPPCPPPFPKGVSNSLKSPPPPPPPLGSVVSPLGKDGAPLPKLKPLHWDKVRATPDRTTVWDKLRSSSFEFDEEMIESLFGYNLQNTMKNDEVLRTKTPSPTKHVLEPKRLQNITILSKALNMTAEQVCDALIQGNGLSLQELEALAKMVPTKEEEAKLSNYKGNINELVSAEKFVKAMLKIPFAFLRIEAMLYRETFDDEVIHLRKSFSMLEEACKELRSSRLFLKLLEAVLKTGNRMNIGTIRGGAKAFKLDALLKLADVKGTDGKTTLLHFVVQEIGRSEGFRVSESIMGKINQRSKGSNAQDKEEDYRRMGLDLVSGLSTELCNVKKTATIDLDVLASSVSNLSDGMSKLQQLVYKDLSTEEKSGNFVHSMRSFLDYAGKNLKELQEDENRVLLHVREITEYFHGVVSKEESNPLRIFVIVRDFLALLDHVCKELRSMKAPSSPNPLSPFR